MRRRRRRRNSRLATLGVVAALGVGAVGVSQANGGSEGPAVPGRAASGAGEGAAVEAAETKAARQAKRAAAGRAAALLVLPTFARATGRYAVAPGTAAVAGEGTVVRYLVEVEDGLGIDPGAFAADVHATLNDGRGWGKGGRTLRFQRVEHGPVRFRVALSSPALTDAQCAPLRTYGNRSCFNGTRAVINAGRWLAGALTYAGDVAAYRHYVVNHEVGHALGHGHRDCPVEGGPAPIMVQQTKSLEGCTANPWPYPKARNHPGRDTVG